MKTKNLLKLSLITAIIGTFLIVLLANTLEPKITQISTINERMLDEWVKIEGNVTSERVVDSLTILNIYDGTAGIHAIIYKKTQGLEGKHVTILGKVIEYKQELEIEINKITIQND